MTQKQIKNKSTFVAKLSNIFSEYNLYDVANMVYMTDGATFEKVVILFKRGGSTSADILLDSPHRAILDDILKALKRYEKDEMIM